MPKSIANGRPRGMQYHQSGPGLMNTAPPSTEKETPPFKLTNVLSTIESKSKLKSHIFTSKQMCLGSMKVK